MRKRYPVQGCINERASVGIGGVRWRREGHSALPIFRRLRMCAYEENPPLAGPSFDDGGSPIWILAHHRTPTGVLRPILPVVLDRWRADSGNLHGCFVDALIHDSIKVEPHTFRQVQPVVGEISG